MNRQPAKIECSGASLPNTLWARPLNRQPATIDRSGINVANTRWSSHVNHQPATIDRPPFRRRRPDTLHYRNWALAAWCATAFEFASGNALRDEDRALVADADAQVVVKVRSVDVADRAQPSKRNGDPGTGGGGKLDWRQGYDAILGTSRNVPKVFRGWRRNLASTPAGQPCTNAKQGTLAAAEQLKCELLHAARFCTSTQPF
eukprot:186136-Chlamydomonas_euryale.AAC.7